MPMGWRFGVCSICWLEISDGPWPISLLVSSFFVKEPPEVSLHAYGHLVLAHYFSGAWDDALLTAEQGLLEAGIHPRPDAVPLMHLAATCVAAGRGPSRRPNGTLTWPGRRPRSPI